MENSRQAQVFRARPGDSVLQCQHCTAHVFLKAGEGCECCKLSELAWYKYNMQTWQSHKSYCADCIRLLGMQRKAANKENSFDKWQWECCRRSFDNCTLVPRRAGSDTVVPPPPRDIPPPSRTPSPPPVAPQAEVLSPASSMEHMGNGPRMEGFASINDMNQKLVELARSFTIMNENMGMVIAELASSNTKLANIREEQERHWAQQEEQQEVRMEGLQQCCHRLQRIEGRLGIPTTLDDDDEDMSTWQTPETPSL